MEETKEQKSEREIEQGDVVVSKEYAAIAKSLLASIHDLITSDKDELENAVAAGEKIVDLLELQSDTLHAQKSLLVNLLSAANCGIGMSSSATNLMQIEAMTLNNAALENLYNELVNTSQYHSVSIEVITKLINHITEIQKALTVLTSKLGLKGVENPSLEDNG